MADRAAKQRTVTSIGEIFGGAGSAVVFHYRGMTVDQMTKLRGKARQQGAKIKVTKNTLARIALKDSAFGNVSELFKGPTAIIASQDAVSAAKTITDYAKSNDKVIVLGGAVEGKLLDAAGVKALASMPSLDESRARIVGLLKAPATRIACLLQAPGGQIARVIRAHAEKSA